MCSIDLLPKKYKTHIIPKLIKGISSVSSFINDIYTFRNYIFWINY